MLRVTVRLLPATPSTRKTSPVRVFCHRSHCAYDAPVGDRDRRDRGGRGARRGVEPRHPAILEVAVARRDGPSLVGHAGQQRERVRARVEHGDVVAEVESEMVAQDSGRGHGASGDRHRLHPLSGSPKVSYVGLTTSARAQRGAGELHAVEDARAAPA
jgi:hypothetical protein